MIKRKIAGVFILSIFVLLGLGLEGKKEVMARSGFKEAIMIGGADQSVIAAVSKGGKSRFLSKGMMGYGMQGGMVAGAQTERKERSLVSILLGLLGID